MIKDKVVDKKTLSKPKIYGYTDKTYPGLIKVGYTTIGVKDRVKQQYPTKRPDIPYKIILEESAIREDGTTFIDEDVHYILRSKGFPNPAGEWFKCTINDSYYDNINDIIIINLYFKSIINKNIILEKL